jgi:hypothetical protein
MGNRVLALPEMLKKAEEVRDHLGLERMAFSENIYLGDCPLCGAKKSFFMWVKKANFHCYLCGADGIFGRAPESMISTIREASVKES